MNSVINIYKVVVVTVISFLIPASFAESVVPMKVLTKTLEEVKIDIKSEGENNSTGSVKTRFIDCASCEPGQYTYNSSTLLINPFGAEKPISTLKSWSGSRALVRFRTSDKQIVLIKILP